MTVSELTDQFDVSQPAISQHLTTLRLSGLVLQRKDGRQMYYRAAPEGMKTLFSWINLHRAFWQERMPRLNTLLEEMKDE